MTNPPSRRKDAANDPAIARRNRLRDALRENLKRRKSQSRSRADQTADGTVPEVDAAAPPDTDRTDPNGNA